jgi:hypothetical protein
MSKHKRKKSIAQNEQQEIVRLLTSRDIKIAVFRQGYRHYISITNYMSDHPHIIQVSSRTAGNIYEVLAKSRYAEIEVSRCQT